MSRLRAGEIGELGPRALALVEHAKQAGAPDHRIVSIFTRSAVGVAFFEFWKTMMAETDLPLRLKELVRLRISAGEQCGYCMTMRSNAAKAEGVDEGLIAELMDYEHSDRFTKQEHVALQFADLYRKDPSAIDHDDVWAELKAHFTDAQIIELGLFVGVNAGGMGFAKALKLVTWEEACEITPEALNVMKRVRDREVCIASEGLDV